MKKKIKNLELFKLYFNYCFSKKSLIIMLVSLLLLSIALFLLCNFNEELNFYLKNYESIHSAYISQSVLLIEIINALLIAFISTLITSGELAFDSLFISYIPKYKIVIAKQSSIIIFLSIFILLELLIVSMIGYFEFPYYNVNVEVLNLAAYLFILLYIEVNIALVTSIILSNSFSMILSFIIFIAYSFIKGKLETSLDCYNKLFPILQYNFDDYIFPFYGIIFSFALSLIFIIIYYNKNLKTD